MRDARRVWCDWCGEHLGFASTPDLGEASEECCRDCYTRRLVATVEAQAALIEAWVPLGVTMASRMGPPRHSHTTLTITEAT